MPRGHDSDYKFDYTFLSKHHFDYRFATNFLLFSPYFSYYLLKAN